MHRYYLSHLSNLSWYFLRLLPLVHSFILHLHFPRPHSPNSFTFSSYFWWSLHPRLHPCLQIELSFVLIPYPHSDFSSSCCHQGPVVVSNDAPCLTIDAPSFDSRLHSAMAAYFYAPRLHPTSFLLSWLVLIPPFIDFPCVTYSNSPLVSPVPKNFIGFLSRAGHCISNFLTISRAFRTLRLNGLKLGSK